MHRREEERWIPWMPENLVPDEYELYEIVQSWEGVRLRFIGRRVNVTIEYGSEFVSLRSCDESERWRSVARELAVQGKAGFGRRLAFTAVNSRYAEWLCEESAGVQEKERLVHCVFVACNDLVDVLSYALPKVTVEPRDTDRTDLWNLAETLSAKTSDAGTAAAERSAAKAKPPAAEPLAAKT